MPNAIERFLQLIDSENFHIPFATEWAVFISLPPRLVSNLPTIAEFEGPNWVPKGASDLTSQRVLFDEGVGCIFADEVTQVGDNFSVADATIGDEGTTGGIIPGVYSRSRQGFAQKKLSIKFRETSLSFTDFFLRPWMIFASHYGLIADQSEIIKAPQILVMNFGKKASTGPIPIRKQFMYFQCVPHSIEDITLTYEKNAVMSYNVLWSFERYAIQDPASAVIEDLNRVSLPTPGEVRDSINVPQPQGIIRQEAEQKRQQLNRGQRPFIRPTGDRETDRKNQILDNLNILGR